MRRGHGVAERVGAADGEQRVVVLAGRVDVAEWIGDLGDGVEEIGVVRRMPATLPSLRARN